MTSPPRHDAGHDPIQETLNDPSPRFAYREYGADGVGGEQALAGEVAVALSYNGINHAVMMPTPEHAGGVAVLGVGRLGHLPSSLSRPAGGCWLRR